LAVGADEEDEVTDADRRLDALLAPFDHVMLDARLLQELATVRLTDEQARRVARPGSSSLVLTLACC
jgi:hypothetical protein